MYKEILNLERLPFTTNWSSISFKQNKVSNEIKERFAENIKLQEEIMRVVKKRNEQFNYKCGIIKAKTGIWKSHICMDIIEYLQTPTLILVSNLKLMQEMIDKIESMTNYKAMVSQYGGKYKDIGYLTVMTKKSFDLCKDEDELSDFDCVIVDENHQGFTKKFRDKFNTVFHNKDIYLYGLSATPYTAELNTSDLEKYYGKIIEVKKDYDFIPSFIFFNYFHIEDYEFEAYHELKQWLIDDPDRTKHQEERVVNNLSKKCSLILCDRLEDIDNWFCFLSELKWHTVIKITWETKIEDDKKQLKDALKLSLPIIIIWSIQKTSTGFDYPIIDTIFLFSSIKFESTVIQSVWRWLRKSPWKTSCKVLVRNDKILDKQRVQKMKAIQDEYWVSNKTVEQVYINKQRKKKWQVALTF